MKTSAHDSHLSESLESALPQGLPNRPDDDRPLAEQLTDQAHFDIKSNIVTEDGMRYFGAGKGFGTILYTRDISFAGLFACNRHYPEIMLDSLKVTREVHLENHPWIAASEAIVPEIDGPWQDAKLPEREMIQKYRTNSWTRRTDDVIWLWAAHDLFLQHPEMADWAWLLETGERCFTELYAPFHNPDGLYSGQQCFVDVQDAAEAPHLRGGYPIHFLKGDCIRSCFLSTNSIYYRAMLGLADAARRLGDTEKADHWTKRADAQKAAILNNLTDDKGRLCMMKEHTSGRLETRRDAVGLALAVHFGILEGEAARRSFADYPRASWGVPLWDEFWPHDHRYHNHTSWPFVDALFMSALEIVDGESHTAEAAHMLARGCQADGSFKELTDYRNGETHGSSNQLWTAAAWLFLMEGGRFSPPSGS